MLKALAWGGEDHIQHIVFVKLFYFHGYNYSWKEMKRLD
jgi:hypothetical protein